MSKNRQQLTTLNQNQSREHVGIPLAWYEQNLKDYAERYVNDLRTIGIIARIVRHKDGWLVIS